MRVAGVEFVDNRRGEGMGFSDGNIIGQYGLTPGTVTSARPSIPGRRKNRSLAKVDAAAAVGYKRSVMTAKLFVESGIDFISIVCAVQGLRIVVDRARKVRRRI